MRFFWIALVLIDSLAFISCGSAPSQNQSNGSTGNNPPSQPSTYKLIAWSELGMHCMDGKDYSVFAVLPPYNVVHAQLIKIGEPPAAVTAGVTITYEATADAQGSINSISSTKTNFWSYVNVLFHNNNAPDVGLTGNSTQSATPHTLSYDTTNAYWTADGIPTVPYDDHGVRNAYPMAKIVARDANNAILATAAIVLTVSDEMSCTHCHASNSNPSAKPSSGWENDPDLAKDVKWNILKRHDQFVDATPYLAQLSKLGYSYQKSLYATAKSGTPILCASCHSTNALGAPGLPGVESVTAAMHKLHGPVTNLSTGQTLDNETSSLNSCYLCHPGVETKCQRGAMNKQECMDCHGNPTQIGNPSRRGWLDVPACQMCHTNSNRYATTFDAPNHWRQTNDATFATNPNKPAPGAALYRYSSGHGSVYCSGCHGSPHGEYPTLQANDNVYSQALQGHTGTIAECSVCHTQVPTTANGGPHNIHNVGQAWVNGHHDYIGKVGQASCAYCHGPDFRGSFLSKTSMARTFSTEGGQKSYTAGAVVSCYDCHNGPNGG